jgi:hypothetical protein
MTEKHIINVIRIKRSYGESDHPGSELGFFLEVARGRGILSRVPTAQIKMRRRGSGPFFFFL